MNLEQAYLKASKYYANDLIILNYLSKYQQLFEKINELSKKKDYFVIAIDGHSSSGKTTLAEIIKFIFDANVIHMDDFFMPNNALIDKRIIGSNIDFHRLKEEVIQPLKMKSDLSYHTFDCKLQTLSPRIVLKSSKITVVEGAYSMHEHIGIEYDMKIFLKIRYFKQLRRINKRNGFRSLVAFITKWIPKEHVYFKHHHVEKKADFVYFV